ncbi:hypothetical protein PM082_012572 [Marasmius tenuissimus]|nr:hypothetical protein PM082_012572 [Marasmius tenuissimus]
MPQFQTSTRLFNQCNLKSEQLGYNLENDGYDDIEARMYTRDVKEGSMKENGGDAQGTSFGSREPCYEFKTHVLDREDRRTRVNMRRLGAKRRRIRKIRDKAGQRDPTEIVKLVQLADKVEDGLADGKSISTAASPPHGKPEKRRSSSR